MCFNVRDIITKTIQTQKDKYYMIPRLERRLRALAALAGSIPSTHTTVHNYLYFQL